MSQNESESDGSDDELELSGSQLGRQAYWDAAYEKELRNWEENGDVGEVWFGDDVLQTCVDFTADVLQRLFKSPEAAMKAKIHEVGCGNGTMLMALAKKGFKNLSGGDYSEPSLRLAHSILAKNGLVHITLKLEDIIDGDDGDDGVDAIVDKGTLDAIGLSAEGAKARNAYRSTVWHNLRPIGYLIITSCNSTREELIEEFCGRTSSRTCAFNSHSCPHTRFREVDHVKTYPRFKFGGVEGSRVCTVAFQKMLPGGAGVTPGKGMPKQTNTAG